MLSNDKKMTSNYYSLVPLAVVTATIATSSSTAFLLVEPVIERKVELLSSTPLKATFRIEAFLFDDRSADPGVKQVSYAERDGSFIIEDLFGQAEVEAVYGQVSSLRIYPGSSVIEGTLEIKTFA